MNTTWEKSIDPIGYLDALTKMGELVHLLQVNQQETIWLLEHPPLYTAGTSAKATDLLMPQRFPVYQTGRGGQYTYHGPGQRIAYVIIDLNRRQRDIRAYISSLENWIILTLAHFGIKGEARPDRVGIWVNTPHGEKKIAAIGVRISKWTTQHGIALNVHPNLNHFSGIIPCGLSQFGVTSMHDLGLDVTLDMVDQILHDVWEKISFLSNKLSQD